MCTGYNQLSRRQDCGLLGAFTEGVTVFLPVQSGLRNTLCNTHQLHPTVFHHCYLLLPTPNGRWDCKVTFLCKIKTDCTLRTYRKYSLVTDAELYRNPPCTVRLISRLTVPAGLDAVQVYRPVSSDWIKASCRDPELSRRRRTDSARGCPSLFHVTDGGGEPPTWHWSTTEESVGAR